jgi:hypothetical protein
MRYGDTVAQGVDKNTIFGNRDVANPKGLSTIKAHIPAKLFDIKTYLSGKETFRVFECKFQYTRSFG